MKRHLIATMMFALMLMAANGASAGPFEDALAAHSRQDYATALRLWKPLADKGNGAAQFYLGVMYSNGWGVAQDYKEAVKWYRLAAAQGRAEAHYNLGLLYANGRGVAQDYVRAHMWWNLAASSWTDDDHKSASTNRDIVAKSMTPSQIEKAQDMARKCQASNFQQCD